MNQLSHTIDPGRFSPRLALVVILVSCGVAATGCKSFSQGTKNDAAAGGASGAGGGAGGTSSRDGGPMDAVTDVPAASGGAGGRESSGGSGGAAGGGTSSGGASSGGTGAGGLAGPGGGGASAGGAGGGMSACDGPGQAGSCGSMCKPGTVDCTSGAPLCVQKNAAPGTTCGTNQVCDSNGSCVACTAGSACGTTCMPGMISCGTGAPVCNQTNTMTGTSCGTNMVCNSSGACVAKTADGGMCTVSAECQNANCSKYTPTGASLCCATGSTNCGSCTNTKTDGNNCNTCGNKCGANKTCSGGSCVCSGYALLCGGCGVWNFDSGLGMTEGWGTDTNTNFPFDGPAGNATTGITTSTSKPNAATGSSGSLAVTMNADFVTLPDGSVRDVGAVAAPVCTGSNTVNIAGYTMSAWLYFDGPPFDAFTFIYFDAYGPSASDREPVEIGESIPTKVWHQKTLTFTSATVADHISIEVGAGTNWAGTIYVDQVTFSGP